jgi:hypothetical protein
VARGCRNFVGLVPKGPAIRFTPINVDRLATSGVFGESFLHPHEGAGISDYANLVPVHLAAPEPNGRLFRITSVRTIDEIDKDLSLVASIRSVCRREGWQLPSIARADRLLDERRAVIEHHAVDADQFCS